MLSTIDFTLRRIRRRIRYGGPDGTDFHIQKRRRELSDQLCELFDTTVQYGPFKGLKLDPEVSWATTHRAPALLGLYEKEVLDALSSLKGPHRIFVDIGASDGYYGVGVLAAGLFDRSYCFEASELGPKIIMKNARINGVSDRITVYGRADSQFYCRLADDGVELSKTVIICDIEGGEFSIFDKAAFDALQGSIIFIEMHDMFFENGAELLQEMRANAQAHFRITELTTSSRDLSPFKELRSFSDSDRWLICSEGRAALMSWLRFDPL